MRWLCPLNRNRKKTMSDQGEYGHVNCAAFGCNLMGTMTRATSGSKEWWCFLHFGAEPEHWGAITTELRRLSWLVDVTRKIREGAHEPHGWRALESALHKEILLSQRKDLCRGDHESITKWLLRLEGVLQLSCNAATQSKQPEMQS